MMERYSVATFMIGVILCVVPQTYGYGKHRYCNMIYEEGGAPAVLRSPNCSHWEGLLNKYFMNHSTDCDMGVGTIRDHVPVLRNQSFCNLNMWIPFFGNGKTGLEYVKVGLVANFDSNSPTDAAKLLNDYFILHTYFLRDAPHMKRYMEIFVDKEEHEFNFDTLELDQDNEVNEFRLKLERFSHNRAKHTTILKEALLRTLYDIKSSSSKEADARMTHSDCIATAILLIKSKILATSGCQSRAFICKDKIMAYTGWSVDVSRKRLTRNRVKSSGVSVASNHGYQIDGQLDPSQSVRDVYLKNLMVARVETNWQTLTPNHEHLVVASEGIFDKFLDEDICVFISGFSVKNRGFSERYIPTCHGTCRPPLSQANCTVDRAYMEGNDGDLSAVVVSLSSAGFVELKKVMVFLTDAQRAINSAYQRAVVEYCSGARDSLFDFSE